MFNPSSFNDRGSNEAEIWWQRHVLASRLVTIPRIPSSLDILMQRTSLGRWENFAADEAYGRGWQSDGLTQLSKLIFVDENCFITWNCIYHYNIMMYGITQKEFILKFPLLYPPYTYVTKRFRGYYLRSKSLHLRKITQPMALYKCPTP